jgi:hypothetical protein
MTQPSPKRMSNAVKDGAIAGYLKFTHKNCVYSRFYMAWNIGGKRKKRQHYQIDH